MRSASPCRKRHSYLLHPHLAIVRLQLWKFLKAQRHGHLVGACRTDKTVYLVEVQGGQLVHDDAHRDVSFGVDPCYQAVEHEGVQRTDDLLLFRVVGNHEVARMLPV